MFIIMSPLLNNYYRYVIRTTEYGSIFIQKKFEITRKLNMYYNIDRL